LTKTTTTTTTTGQQHNINQRRNRTRFQECARNKLGPTSPDEEQKKSKPRLSISIKFSKHPPEPSHPSHPTKFQKGFVFTHSMHKPVPTANERKPEQPKR